MGLLITLFLISSNVYTAVNAPLKRGFSYIEVWIIGSQGVILFAIIEYGFVLGWKKFDQRIDHKDAAKTKMNWFKSFSSISIDEKMKIVDAFCLIFSISSFLCFNIYYWYNTLSIGFD